MARYSSNKKTSPKSASPSLKKTLSKLPTSSDLERELPLKNILKVIQSYSLFR